MEEVWESFEDQREDITDFIKDSDLNFRNYIFEMPFGKLDGFQMLEFTAGHTARHTAQIDELKISENFPQ
ncbi:DinB family protein [Gramella sp. AN32]|uniref:DinB family protein n=1 Tax=Christiangramia antarctica TaxID=2058158 RepID=A0ABW5X260_9FLAO|nr:DinB family protein [Gramella sp. AN32]